MLGQGHGPKWTISLGVLLYKACVHINTQVWMIGMAQISSTNCDSIWGTQRLTKPMAAYGGIQKNIPTNQDLTFEKQSTNRERLIC